MKTATECAAPIRLARLHSPPEPLSAFLSAFIYTCVEAFLGKHPQYNSCFQNDIVRCNEHSARKLHADIQSQGQIYHHAGSLLPLPDADHKFLQIYFMANSDEQIEQRCHYNAGTRREIVGALQGLFDQHNELVRLFKTAIQRMPADDYTVVIRAETKTRWPTRETVQCTNNR
ncbi:uncharacterized protein TNCV_4823561 [Trichonephila clavipes]|nr:uncharacterized protein TNCV_4823561 [Trichonephila clavipes]